MIIGIFAHPDDEAFGPSGAFTKAVHEGAELHLITLPLSDAREYRDRFIEVMRADGKMLGMNYSLINE